MSGDALTTNHDPSLPSTASESCVRDFMAPDRAARQLSQPQRAVLLSIAGLKPEYLAEADARGLKIPALRSLMASGSRAKGMESVWPTVTSPAHTTLVTGVSPARHGILANGPFDPLAKNW